jgi:uncharacterized Zn-finger protein
LSSPSRANRLKLAPRGPMPFDMARAKFIECPICDTDVPLDGAGPGDEVFCSYCGAPITIAAIKDDESVEIEEY